ncbi:phosphoribosylpyrophosphate synthetase [Candidatus Poribacteria bacterium]|nr:phosphoribosylpyrophosphate synthetase [Candidatus Poribacteria bacterium]
MYASSAQNGVRDRLRLFSGRANPGLAKEIADRLGVSLGKLHVRQFPDTETKVQIEESVREADIFIVQPTCPPVNENLMELLVSLDAFQRASAGSVTAVIPYYGYAKQDRKSTGREPISARLVADLLTKAGADRVISVDLHVAQIQGFFAIPMDHLTALTTIAGYLQTKDLSDAVLVSPDVGRVKLAEKYSELLDLPIVLMHKRRAGGSGTPEVVGIVGDVEGKTPIIVDDMISTGGTIRNSAEALMEAGSKPCYIAATHGVLIGEAMTRLAADSIREVIVTNTVPVSAEKLAALPTLRVLSIADLLSDVIGRIHRGDSVSEVFNRGTEQQIHIPV